MLKASGFAGGGKADATLLPVHAHLDEICRQTMERGILVLEADPGAGKTSLVPLALAAHPVLGHGKVVVLEPRRLAAVAAAHRAADLIGESAGGQVGYRVRYESMVGAATCLEFITEALLPPLVLASPGLPEVSALVLDEFHERSVHADLALALARECRELNPDLHIVLMSATIDGASLAQRLNAANFKIPGKLFPVDLRYNPLASDGRFNAPAFAGVVSKLQRETEGDLLAFLPGWKEIRAVQDALIADIDRKPTDRRSVVEIAPLHGSMSLDEQRRILDVADSAPRRIILATSIAETSLTVPRVRLVVDAGLSRAALYEPRTGMDRLVTRPVSQAQADQRSGRAGRLGPGIAVRCWSAGERLSLAAVPQLLTSELSGLVLFLAAWGVRERTAVAWLDAPPPAAWQAAVDLLQALDLLAADGAINERGRRVLEYGVHPRLGAMLEAGIASGRPRETALLAALLGEGQVPDGQSLEEVVVAFGRVLAEDGGAARTDRLLSANTAAVLREYRRLARLPALSAHNRYRAKTDGFRLDSLGSLVAAGWPDRLARRLPEGESGARSAGSHGCNGMFTFINGRKAACKGSLAQAEWLVATDVDAGETSSRIYTGFALSEAEALPLLEAKAKIVEQVTWRGWQAQLWQRRLAGTFVLSERQARPDRQTVEPVLLEKIRMEGWSGLPLGDASRRLLDRLAYAVRVLPERQKAVWEELPDPDPQALLASAAGWLLPFAVYVSGPLLDETALYNALQALYRPWLQPLDAVCPEYFITPAGSRRLINYPADADAFLEIKIQELFGTAASPLVAGRPLVLRLLSPAGRPLQITSDLASFWRTAYRELRNPLKSRYPKHYWPDDPLQAEPTRGLKPRRT